jgi:hypothetical protein
MPYHLLVGALVLGAFVVSAVRTTTAAQDTSVTGTVTDRSGGHVADARVELSSGGPVQTVRTGPDGRYRFVLLEPGSYRVTVTHPGFRTVTREVELRSGDLLALPFVLDLGLETRVDVDARRRPAPSSVSRGAEELQALPGSRDPGGLVWAVPGAVADRPDAAGAESLTPGQFIYRGSRGLDTAWTIDGIVVTDRQTGRAPGYYDVDSLADLQFVPAAQDITRPGNGLGVNMVMRSGTDRLRASARGFFTGAALQSHGVRPGWDHTRQVHEYGADVGGPLAPGRAWFMASASAREARLYRLASGHERAEASPLSLKVNWQVTAVDRLNLLWLDHPERRYGINPSGFLASPDALQDQSPLYPHGPLRGLWKIEHARMAGPLSLTARYAYYGTGFQLRSRGTGAAGLSEQTGEAIGATLSSWSTRPQHTLAADASLFRTMAGGGHDLRAGGGWQQVDMRNGSRWPGDGVVALENSGSDLRARIHRATASHSRLVFGHAYVSDTLTSDRLTIDLGLRVDLQHGESLPSLADGNPFFPSLAPAIEVEGDSTRQWIDLSPRGSILYALTPGGRLAVRGSAGRFASQQVMAAVVQTNPAGMSGWIEFPWEDHNRDRLAQPHEVRIDLPFLAFEGLDPLGGGSFNATTTLDPAVVSRIVTTASIGIEAELGRFANASLSYHYARHTRWPVLRWEGMTASDYQLARVLSVTLPEGTRVDVPIYTPDPDVIAAHGARRVLASDDGFYTTYRGLELMVTRRLSRGWSLTVAAAWNDSRAFHTEPVPTNGFGNPTRLDGSSGGQLTAPRDPLVQGGQVAPFAQPLGSGGRTFLNARWQGSASSVIRLPWNVEAAATLTGREGGPSPYIVRQSLGLDGNRPVLVTPRVDSVRLEPLWNLDARIGRSVRIGRTKVQLLADVFNVLNADTALVKDRNLRSLNFDRVTMRVSPRILRLGLRLSY